MFTNCQEEFDAIQKSSSKTATVRKVLVGEKARAVAAKVKPYLKNKGPKAMAALRKMQGSDGAGLRTFADVESMIDYSRVLEISYPNGDVNYTFAFNEPKATESVFYNLIIKKRNGNSKSLIIRYDMDSNFALNYNQGKMNFEDFTGVMYFELLDVDSGFPCEDEPDIPIPVSGGSGTGSSGGSGGSGGSGPGGGGSGGGGSGGGSGGSGGAGSGGSGSAGYGYSQTVVNMQHLSLQLAVAEEDPDPSGDDSDNGEESEGCWLCDIGWIKVSRSPRFFRTVLCRSL